ncbi:hypothetical protein GCM10023168_18690 [Fodinibacter luteus]|uniref:Uncharacterized protein n=1 Tax=Fodinibacter luteus TaxID=552064 RepID=A0ABP8KFB2_9MICO
MTTVDENERKESVRDRFSGRPTGLFAGLGVIAALALGFGIGRTTVEQPSGLASEEVSTMLGARIAAVNGEPGPDVASFYSTEAVLEEQDQDPPVVTRGAQQISDHLAAYRGLGFRIDPSATPAIRLGRYVAEGLTWAYGYQGGIVVYELDDDGRIAHSWVIGGTP